MNTARGDSSAFETHSAGDFAATGPSLYQIKNRPRRDNFWTAFYLILTFITFSGGIAAFIKSDKDGAKYSRSFYSNSTSCDVDAFNNAVSLLGTNTDIDINLDTFANAFAKAIAAWLPITVIGGIATSVVYVLLFKRYAEAMVKIAIGFTLSVIVAMALLSFAVGAFPSGIILAIFACVWGGVFWYIRDSLPICAKLLSVAGRGLQENSMLVPSAIMIKVAGLGVLIYQFSAFVSALNVGKVVKAADVQVFRGPQSPEIGVCADALGYRVDCCSWAVESWAAWYAFFCMFTALWTVQVIVMFKLYMVADTMAQWYFQPAGAFSNSASQPSIRQALTHAVTSSWGSIVFAAGIMMVIDYMRALCRRMARNNLICCLLNSCIIQPLLAMLEQFTRFATIAVAITGLGFVDASKQIYGVLKRNFLQTYTLWWVPGFVLRTISTLLSLAWAGLVFALTLAATKDSDYGMGLAWIMALICLAVVGFVLDFISTMLLDIVNTVYICFSMDRDVKHVTRPEIHAIYQAVPTLQGAIIQNPGGDVLYGAPQVAQHPYAPVAVHTVGNEHQHMLAGAQNSSGAYGQPSAAPYGQVPPYGQPSAAPYGQVPPYNQSSPYGYGHNNV